MLQEGLLDADHHTGTASPGISFGIIAMNAESSTCQRFEAPVERRRRLRASGPGLYRTFIKPTVLEKLSLVVPHD
jgi:hypothetical protein